jgi:hypothetical protein
MAHDRMKLEDVAAWVGEVLGEYDGLYDLQDHLFVRNAVRVVTKRRDACFDIPGSSWTNPVDADAHEVLAQDLRRWARQSLKAAG